MLHVAPEPHISRRIRQHAFIDYLSADLKAGDAMVAMDITVIPHAEGHFDVIYCSHVLEHVLDDRKAMHELCRVLAPEGWAVLQVPITADETFEDPSITDPAERERLFGRYDHVRRYGPDYANRLSEAGFDVKKINAVDAVGAESIEQLGIMRDEDIFFCTK